MILGKAVHTGRTERAVAVGGLVLGDHAVAAAGVAGQRETAEQRVGMDQSVLNQRRDQRDEAGSMAARVGDTLGIPDQEALAVQLGQTVDPIVVGTMGGGTVDDDGIGAFDHFDCLPCRVIGQAKERDIGCIERLFAGGCILAEFFGQGDQLDVPALVKSIADAQSGGAVAAVDKYLSHYISS